MRLSILLSFSFLCVAIAPRSTAAQSPTIDPDATVVELRLSCAMPNSTYLDNCFETTADVTHWLWGTGSGTRSSEPNSLDSVTVRVGPGDFGAFKCDATSAPGARGFVSVIGSGRDVTSFDEPVVILNNPTLVCEGGITSIDCTDLTFADLTASGVGTGVLWLGVGDSFWESVDIETDSPTGPCAGGAYGWFDRFGESLGEESPGAVHYFFSSRLAARGNRNVAAFKGTGESWFYGSDFLVTKVGSSSSYAAAVRQESADGVRIFGSSVRGIGEATAGGLLAGLQSVGPGVVHMHGGIINVNSPAGIAVGGSTDHVDGLLHILETAFNLASPSFSSIRMYGPGKTPSPFIWPRGTTPPDIRSFTGADFFVKTDEGPGQNEARLYVFDASCSANGAGPTAWRNMTTGNCI